MCFQQVWNSDTSEAARRQVLSELVSEEPDLRLLYTTPESLRNPTLRSYLQVSLKDPFLLAGTPAKALLLDQQLQRGHSG